MRGQDEAAAVAVAVVLLVGVVLISREAVGLWPTVAVAYGLVLAAYAGPMVARRAAVEAEVRRYRREIRRTER
ncbi:hypothetical protein [Streptomyces sp. SID3915]|uniref:hypothetical protein n=1 Tax=Streptomyces sp. SID3915 TaxID=2690263 RepID=UPI00136980B0|nr:hypothetical protein [Streptomyces sp. SID3915]MYX75087.1 hypothetical protein [Streptomyces sp. SID3915]